MGLTIGPPSASHLDSTLGVLHKRTPGDISEARHPVTLSPPPLPASNRVKVLPVVGHPGISHHGSLQVPQKQSQPVISGAPFRIFAAQLRDKTKWRCETSELGSLPFRSCGSSKNVTQTRFPQQSGQGGKWGRFFLVQRPTWFPERRPRCTTQPPIPPP